MNIITTTKKLLFAACILVPLTGCGDGARPRETPPAENLSAADAALAVTVGSGNQVVLADSKNFALTMVNNLATVVSIATVSTQTKNDAFTSLNNAFSENPDTTNTFEISDVFDNNLASFDAGIAQCTLGGTRQIAGSLTLSLSNGGTNQITGAYSVFYDGCIELVQLITGDGSCLTQVQNDGTITSDTNITFIGSPTGSDTCADVACVIDNNFTTEIGDLSFIEAYYPSGTLGASNFVFYNYDLQRNSSDANTTLSGTFGFGTDTYDINDVSGFIASASSSSVCPAAP